MPAIDAPARRIAVTQTYACGEVQEECVEHYAELNKCINPKWRWLSLKLTKDETQIVVEHAEPASTSLADSHAALLALLPEQEPRWLVLNFPYRTTSGGRRNKIALVSWCPDTLTRPTMKESARIKMSAVTCFGSVKRACKGADCSIQANDLEDLSWSAVLAKVSRFERDAVDFEASAPERL